MSPLTIFARPGAKIISNRDLNQLAMAGAIGAAKVKAVATAAHARGAGIGSAFIQCCSQVYFGCGYVMIYGQMPAVPGLDAFTDETDSMCWT
jgi:hypothetical protein